MNFLALYEKYREVPVGANPVAAIVDEILLQAGWYSVCYGLGLFGEYPYLAKAVRNARVRMRSELPLLLQLFVKFVALFK